MYTQDWDERYPPAPRWEDLIHPYTSKQARFRCPSAPRETFSSYGFNGYLEGLPLEQVGSPESTVLFYETAGNGPNTYGDPGVPSGIAWRHNQGSSFAWAEGYVKWVGRTHYVRDLQEGNVQVRPFRVDRLPVILNSEGPMK